MKSWPTSRAAATPWLIMTMVFTTYIALSNRTPSRRRLILSRPIAAARATPLPGAAGAGRTTATSARTLRATCRRPSGRPPAPTTGTPRRPAIRSWIMLHLPGKPWKATTFRAPQLRRSPAPKVQCQDNTLGQTSSSTSRSPGSAAPRATPSAPTPSTPPHWAAASLRRSARCPFSPFSWDFIERVVTPVVTLPPSSRSSRNVRESKFTVRRTSRTPPSLPPPSSIPNLVIY